jgi:hypothetical protein
MPDADRGRDDDGAPRQDAGERRRERGQRGYRVSRLRRRREGKAQRVQTWVLVTLAVVVAFVAVLGAWYAATRWVGKPAAARPAGGLTLLQLTSSSGKAVAAALVVKDPATGTAALYVVPRDLLLEGPEGEYVFAGDAMATGTLEDDLSHVIGAPIDASYKLPLAALGKLAGGGQLRLSMAEGSSVEVRGTERSFSDGSIVSVAELPALFEAAGPTGWDASRLQEALWAAVTEAAALRPPAELTTTLEGLSSAVAGAQDTWFLDRALKGITTGSAPVMSFPADSRVAEGQFAFVPDADRVLAEIRRRSPSYRSKYTVQVQNGTGQVGVGRAVAEQLAVLDVNLPPVVNAASFDYPQTRILAGQNALQVAEEVRAILGRGVVLDSPDVPDDSVVVIVGADTRLNETKTKDKQ